ncbi:MAG: orotidine 5'-phosphate decarboxylase [Nanoarchaeales archaeon]|nr:orotidine 5'-phosphate decarboxylase [Nanoarchaeales archaeon]
MVFLTEQEQKARERVCVALDTESVDQALEWAKILSPFAKSFKIGKSLHLIAGLEGRNIISEIAEVGGSSFLDLKGHDTPDQIRRYAMAATVTGVNMFNIHVGSKAMNEAALEGAFEKSKILGIEKPLVIGVTELTSLNTADVLRLGNPRGYEAAMLNKAKIAIEDGLDGIVCPAKFAGGLEKKFGNKLRFITPGVQLNGLVNEGQKQVYDIASAVRDCRNSILVVGSAYTKAPNMEKQALLGLREMAPYMN